MSELNELKKIKKMYGEDFMKLCRSLFPTLLEQEGRLYEILSSSFSVNSKTLYKDIVDAGLEESFKDYIYSKVDVEDPEMNIITKKTPYELLEQVGYELTECLTEEEIQEFKKYYKPGEELCTFGDGRLERCVVFWAVKKNVEDIKREDFKNPKREDEYGTSVMGIQFNKSGVCTVSIKNRYNHRVNNPDATYGNDLDRIIPGLTNSFSALLEKEYGIQLNSTNIEKFEIPGYVVANDGKYYKFNMEINGNYYCPGNIVVSNGKVINVANPEEGLLIDYFYVDKKEKKIKLWDNSIDDSFIDGIQGIEKIEVIKSEYENENREIKIYIQDAKETILIGINKNNEIVRYENKDITNIGNDFLYSNKVLSKLELPNLTQVGENFLFENVGLAKLELQNLTKVGESFLIRNKALTWLQLPKLIQTGDCFLYSNKELTKLELPNLTQTGNCFLCTNKNLNELELPNLIQIGSKFLYNNEKLTELKLPKVKQVGSDFLVNNTVLAKLQLPKIKQVGENFLFQNLGLSKLELPNLKQVGGGFLFQNLGLSKLELPKLKQVGDSFLFQNVGLAELELPSLKKIKNDFLANNERLKQLELPNLTKVGDYFLDRNKALIWLQLPKLTQVGNQFLVNNKELAKLELPNLTKVGHDFLINNERLKRLELPSLTQVGSDFLIGNAEIAKIELPKLTKVGKNFLASNRELTKLKLPNLTQVEDNFLVSNHRLAELELPNLPEIKEKFSYIIDRNIKEIKAKETKNTGIITSQNIAKLDKDNELTTSEINLAHKSIENIKGLLKEKNEI